MAGGDGGDEGGSAAAAAAVATAERGARALYPKLKPGPGRSTDEVIANQRARLIGAMVELVAERGYDGITVRGLARLAGVSTKTFYECFENVEDCFAATHARIVSDLLSRANELPLGRQDGERLRAWIHRLFAVLGGEPKAARLVLVDAVSAGSALDARTRASSRALERLVGEELAVTAAPTTIAPRIVNGAAAAVLHLARSRSLAEGPESGAAVADELADWLLAVGGSAAFQASKPFVLGRPAPVPAQELGDDRRFLLAAVRRLSVRDGYPSLTVPAICREAGVTRRKFDQYFDGVTHCFLSAIESMIAESLRRATAQAADAQSWERAIVRAIATFCTEAASEPALARLALVDVLLAGEAGLRLREQTVVRVARILHRTAPSRVRLGMRSAQASVAAAMAIAASEAAPGRPERFGRAAPAAAYVVLAPALGGPAAERAIRDELSSLTRAPNEPEQESENIRPTSLDYST